MRLHFGFMCLMLVSTLALAQDNPVSATIPKQLGGPPIVSRSPQSFSFAQSGTRAHKDTARQREASQGLGLDFANAVVYSSGGYSANSVAVADLNGDGKADIVVANCGSSGSACNSAGLVGVLLGNGDGTFQTVVTYGSGGAGAYAVAVADVNGDGKPDLMVANNCASASNCGSYGPGSVGVLLGNGDGTFQPAVAYGSGGLDAVSVAVAEVNGDGKPDLLVANFCSNCQNYGYGSVGVLLGNGDGTFQTAVTYDSGGWATNSITVADLKGDGKLDVIVAQCSGPTEGCIPGEVGVLLGNGDGTFQTTVNYSSGANYPDAAVVADVNGDGKLDVLVTNSSTYDHEEGNGAVGVLLGNGDGTFQTVVTYDAGGTFTGSLALADVNGDGKPDLVVTDAEDIGGQCSNPGSAVAVLLGNGDGTFQTAVLYCSGGSSADAVAVADVNGDGEPDLVVANACGDSSCDTGSVGVLINTSAIAVLSPISLGFGSQNLGTTSAPQNATLTNTGNFSTTLKISSIGITGANSTEFAQTNHCSQSLPPGGSCTIMVTFTPTAFGNASASLNVTDNISGSPQTVALTGFGQGPGVSLSPSNVSFPSQYVGTSSLPQSVTLMNIGNTTLTITNVAARPSDFAPLSTCGSSVAPGASCSIGVFFDPTTSGTRNGTLTVTDSASSSPQTAALTGIGQDFSLAPGSQTTATVSPGQSASYKVSVAPGGGFNQTVKLSCSGAPPQSTCSVSPSSLTARADPSRRLP